MRTSTQEAAKPYSFQEGVVTLSLHIQPGASKVEMAGRFGETALKLRVNAPPLDGKANQACARFLAKSLGVPVSAVSILHGSGSRDKVLRIVSVPLDRYQALISQWES